MRPQEHNQSWKGSAVVVVVVVVVYVVCVVDCRLSVVGCVIADALYVVW